MTSVAGGVFTTKKILQSVSYFANKLTEGNMIFKAGKN